MRHASFTFSQLYKYSYLLRCRDALYTGFIILGPILGIGLGKINNINLKTLDGKVYNF